MYFIIINNVIAGAPRVETTVRATLRIVGGANPDVMIAPRHVSGSSFYFAMVEGSHVLLEVNRGQGPQTVASAPFTWAVGVPFELRVDLATAPAGTERARVLVDGVQRLGWTNLGPAIPAGGIAFRVRMAHAHLSHLVVSDLCP